MSVRVLLTVSKPVCREPIEEINIKGGFGDYFNSDNTLKEEMLLSELPAEFTPVPYEEISIMKESLYDKETQRIISTEPVTNLILFKEYENNIDKFILELHEH